MIRFSSFHTSIPRIYPMRHRIGREGNQSRGMAGIGVLFGVWL